MNVPDKFPAGCRFAASSGGDSFVEFPDGGVFKLADSGDKILPVAALPRSGDFMDESRFLAEARSLAALSASK